MGTAFADQFSLLHFAVGVVAYFWGISHVHFLALHIVFEFLENTAWGMNLITKLPIWPGGKTHADAPVNMLGDLVFGQIGWYTAAHLDAFFLRFPMGPRGTQAHR